MPEWKWMSGSSGKLRCLKLISGQPIGLVRVYNANEHRCFVYTAAGLSRLPQGPVSTETLESAKAAVEAYWTPERLVKLRLLS